MYGKVYYSNTEKILFVIVVFSDSTGKVSEVHEKHYAAVHTLRECIKEEFRGMFPKEEAYLNVVRSRESPCGFAPGSRVFFFQNIEADQIMGNVVMLQGKTMYQWIS